MLKKFLITIACVCCFGLQTTTPAIKDFFPFTNNQINNMNNVQPVHFDKNYQTKVLIPLKHKELVKFHHNNDDLYHTQIDKFQHLIELQEKTIGKEIVMKVSGFLPHFDSIGHKILHANNEFVSKILLDTSLPDIVKKDLILFSIKMAQHGDDFGSVLLQLYYDIVNNSL